MTQPVIKQSGNDYAVITPYDAKKSPLFNAMIKRHILPDHRSPQKENGQFFWVIHPAAIAEAQNQIEQIFGVRVEVPALVKVDAGQKYGFQLDYVGIPKGRNFDKQLSNVPFTPDERIAYGLSKGQWRIVFSEKTLRTYFEPKNSCQEETLFSLLLVEEASTEAEIKSGYRRLARQWHPDVNKEPEAGEMFKKINSAYLILSDPLKRKRYEAGLSFERESNKANDYRKPQPEYFIPPLRCGNLTVTGELRVGKLHVAEILSWMDVTNEQGQTMVSSWSKEREAVVIEWV